MRSAGLSGSWRRLIVGGLPRVKLTGSEAWTTFVTTGTFFDESTEQSRIKATIVRDYFWAWAKVILSTVAKRGGRIAYIDLFAGRGRYKDGTKSTPLLVLETAIADPNMRGYLVT